MNLFIDSASNTLIENYNVNLQVGSINFKRGDYEPLNVYFVNNNTITTPASAVTRRIIFGAKEDGAYDSTTFVLYASGGTIVGNHYNLSLSVANSAIDALLHVDGLSTNDLESVTVMSEISWSDDGITWVRSNTFDTVITNNVIRNTENTPLGSPTPEEWLLANLGKPYYPLDENNRFVTSYGISGFSVNALGYDTALENIGEDVNAFGSAAAVRNSGHDVIAIGFEAAVDNTGNYLNAIGKEAGTNNTGNHFNALGYTAGTNNAGEFNQCFGAFTTSGSVSSLSGCLVVGAYAAATTANSIVLGSTTVPFLTASGKTITPQFLLIRINGVDRYLPLYS